MLDVKAVGCESGIECSRGNIVVCKLGNIDIRYYTSSFPAVASQYPILTLPCFHRFGTKDTHSATGLSVAAYTPARDTTNAWVNFIFVTDVRSKACDSENLLFAVRSSAA